MRGTDLMTHSKVILHPNPCRTVVRPFEPADPDGFVDTEKARPQRIAERILALDERALNEELERIMASFGGGREDVERALLRRFQEMEEKGLRNGSTSRLQQLVIGGYFCEEFSFEAAHLLPNVPEGHKCARLHGHSFHARVTVDGPVGESSGWVMDFGDLKSAFELLSGNSKRKAM